MKSNIVIGIEGLVGAGKTSICRELLKKIPNSILVHGGNLYRAIIFAVMQSGVDKKDLLKNAEEIDVKELMEKLKVEVKLENRETEIYVGGTRISQEVLQTKESSIAVSEVAGSAKNENLYMFGEKLIEAFRKKFNVIFSGRDVLKIYPNSKYHFFITADIDSRVERKYTQYEGKTSKEEIKQHIIKRDDLQEKAGFYKTYDKTIVIDTTNCKTIEEETDKVLEYIEESF